MLFLFFLLFPAVAAQLNTGDASPSLAAQMKQYLLLHDASSDPAPSALQKTDDSDDSIDEDPPADTDSMRVRLFEPPRVPPVEQQHTARVLSTDILPPATVDVDIVKPNKLEAPEGISGSGGAPEAISGSDGVPEALSGSSGTPKGLSGSGGAPETLSGNGETSEVLSGSDGVPEALSGSKGTPDGLSGMPEGLSGSRKEPENNAVQEEENNAEMLAQMAMLGSSELRRKQQSLVPKRRRRIGAPILLKRRSAPIIDPRKLRSVFHGCDEMFLFQLERRFLETRKDRNWQLDKRVTELFAEMIVNFLKNDDPTLESGQFPFNWTACSTAALDYLSITDSPTMQLGYRWQAHVFWNRYVRHLDSVDVGNLQKISLLDKQLGDYQLATWMLLFCALFFFAILVSLACYCTRKEADEDEL